MTGTVDINTSTMPLSASSLGTCDGEKGGSVFLHLRARESCFGKTRKWKACKHGHLQRSYNVTGRKTG
jgi:hypothetical protein